MSTVPSPQDSPPIYISRTNPIPVEEAKERARSHDPVIVVEEPTPSLGSLIANALLLLILTLGFIALTVWITVLSIDFYHSRGKIAIFLVVLVSVAICGLLTWPTIGAILDLVFRGKRRFTIGSQGITVRQKWRHVELSWLEISKIGVHVSCRGIVYYHSISIIHWATSETISYPRIRLTLDPKVASRLHSARHSLLGRPIHRHPERAPYNAVIMMAQQKDLGPGHLPTPAAIDKALSRFAGGAYTPIELDPVPINLS